MTRPSRKTRTHSARTRLRRAIEALEPRTLMTASLIDDINPYGSMPSNIAEVGGKIFFAEAEASGNEGLYSTDGTATGTTLIREFISDSISSLTALGSTIFFAANDVTTGNVLWKSDGTTAGTVPVVSELAPDTHFVDPYELVVAGPKLYFLDDASYPVLNETDGTAVGTSKPVGAGLSDYNYSDVTAVGDSVYFLRLGGANPNRQIGAINGPSNSIIEVPAPPSVDQDVAKLAAVGTDLFFFASDGNSGYQLYVSDGKVGGTKQVGSQVFPDVPTEEAAVGSSLYFVIDAGAAGEELYKSDGTDAGTVLITTIASPSATARQQAFGLTAVGSELFFGLNSWGYNTAGPAELYKSDGTAAGTTEVAPINVFTTSFTNGLPDPSPFVVLGNKIYFADNDPTLGPELFSSDGTAVGTGAVADLNPGPEGSGPVNLTVIGGSLYFGGHASPTSDDLFRSDGTAAGTTVVASFPAGPTAGSAPAGGAVLGDDLIFSADDRADGVGVWKTDGTAAGTTLVRAILPQGSFGSLSDFTAFDGLIYFVAPSSSSSTPTEDTLWKTDGTSAGTVMVQSFPYGLEGLTPVGNTLFLVAGGGTSFGYPYFNQLWKTDGTAAGTVELKQFDSNLSVPDQWKGRLAVLGSTVYLATEDAIFKSDGTVNGTTEVATNLSDLSIAGFTPVGNDLFFVADDDETGAELYKTDGTTAGTVLVKDINPGPGASNPYDLTVVGSTVYFGADDGSHGDELWKSDGTSAGTVLVADINTITNNMTPGGSTPEALTAFGSSLLFSAYGGGSFGRVLYKSDGTTAGTVVVNDIDLGGDVNLDTPGGMNISFSVVGPDAFFEAEDNAHGVELWVTNGTTGGTNLVQDINPGSAYSNPVVLGAIPAGLVVAADDGVHGTEPYLVLTSTSYPPAITPVPDQTVDLGKTLTVPIVAAITSPMPRANPVIVYSLGADAPAGASIDPATGTLTFTPSLAGTYHIVVTASDQDGTPPYTATTTVTVDALTPPSYPPAIAPIPDQSVDLGKTLTVPVSAAITSPEPHPDPVLSYSLGADAPAGASIAPTSGVLTFTPTLAGTYHIVVTVADRDRTPPYIATATVNVTVNDVAPTISAGPDARAFRGASFTQDGTVGGPEGDQTYTATVDYGDGSGPQPLMLMPRGAATPSGPPQNYTFALSHAYAAVGRYAVTVVVSDGSAAGTASATFQVAVRVKEAVPGDYDGDGKTDPTIYGSQYGVFAYRPSTGGADVITIFGPGDSGFVPMPADYDGDGKTDLAIYNSQYGVFAYRPSSGGHDVITVFGPSGGAGMAVPGDYDGDGKIDLAVYDTATGTFTYRPSSGAADVTTQFGPAGGFVAVPADYDGDGKTDLAIYNAQYGVFAYRPSSGGADVITVFGPGSAGFVPVPEDFDGDGKADLAIYNPQYGVLAYRPSSGGHDVITTFGTGASGFALVPGDFDGDGRADFALYNSLYADYAYRPSSGGGDVIQVFGPPDAGFMAPGQSPSPQATAAQAPTLSTAQSVPAGPAKVAFASTEKISEKARLARIRPDRRAAVTLARALPAQAEVSRKN